MFSIHTSLAVRFEDVAQNNWDGAAEQAIADKKLDKVIGFQLTEEAALKMTCHNDAGRDVCVYKDDKNGGTSGLNLNDPKTVKRMIVHDYAYKC